MSAWFRRLPPYALLTLFALPALWPFTHPGLPRTNDTLTHYYRFVELDRLVRAGELLPRWAPDLVHGFGYPVFNFFPSTAHYLAVLFHLLGLTTLGAYKAASVLVLLAAAWWAYRLGREHFGEMAGLVAGVAYLYSPFILYDTHIRGSLPEPLALALLPLAMLYLRRAAQGDRHARVWASLAVAAFVLAHHGVALQAMPFLVAYGLWERWGVSRGQLPVGSRQSAVRSHASSVVGRPSFVLHQLSFAISPFVVALLLSAAFWLPAITEAQYVQTERNTSLVSVAYWNNFLSLREMFAFARLPVDPDLLNPPVVHPLPVLALALAALNLLRLRGSSHRTTLAFFALATLAAIYLLSPLAKPLWDAVPLLQLTFLPWRLLGPISLFAALLAGAVFTDVPIASPQSTVHSHQSTVISPQSTVRSLQSAVLLPSSFFLFILAGLPFASPPFEAAPENATLADVAAFEVPPMFIGTTTVGEYLPIWVKQMPDTSAGYAALRAGQPVERYDVTDGRITHVASRALGDTFEITTAEPFTFAYRMFYFPGWRATVNGRPAPVRPTDPEGWMAVDLPVGATTLSFEFGSTLPRVAGGMLSVAGLFTVGGIVIKESRRQKAVASHQSSVTGRQASPANALWPRASLFLLALFLATARPLLYDAGYTPLLRPGLTPDGLLGVQHPLNMDFAGELTLLGWDVERETLGADDSVTVHFYWKATHPLGLPYGFNVRLRDAAGLTWSEPDPPRPRDWRFTPGTDFWPEDQYIMDAYVLTPVAGAPPGEYQIEVTAFSRVSLQSIGAVPVGTITITTPTRERACAETDRARLGPDLTVQAAALDRAQAAPGDRLVVTLCWRAGESGGSDLDGELMLLDGVRRPVVVHPFTLGGQHPVSRWNAGDLVRDQVVVQLPAALETGDYVWAVEVGGASATLDALHITAPERVFTAPEVGTRLDANLGPVTLFGVTLPAPGAVPGSPVTVTLAWEANRVMASGYHVFVHLMDAAGNLAAQSDGVPAAWSRPTTGWLPGEFVTEARLLTLPADVAPGQYALFAGMYDPATNNRLASAQFPDGRVPLGSVTVAP